MRFELEKWQRNLIVLWFAQLMAMVGYSFVFPFIPLYVQTLGVHGATAAAQWSGVIEAVSAVAMAIAQPIWGNMADRLGRKPMVVRSILGNAIAIILMAFATSPEQLVALRFIQGAVTGTIAASNALVSTTTPKHRLAFALGVLPVAVFAGSSMGPLVGGIIADTFGYKTTFVIAGLMLLLDTLLVAGLVSEDFTRPQPGTQQRGAWAETWSLMTMAVMPILIGVIFLIQLGGLIVAPVLPLYVADLHGSENAATVAGVILAATGVTSAISAVGVGRISDRVGHSLVLTVCLLGAAIIYFPQSFVQETWQLFALRLVLGIFLGGLMPSAYALLAGLVAPARRAAAFGLCATAFALANAIGPLSGAGVATQWGMRSVFLTAGTLFTIAFITVNVGIRGHTASRPHPEVSIAGTDVLSPSSQNQNNPQRSSE
ncbi:MAG: MFS transporter [Chloroflexi bacterium]|nr:MFS transporter [Chloroflexota bacterium]MDA8188166.1 MFS transporter [Dehalococcoidales bacterium]